MSTKTRALLVTTVVVALALPAAGFEFAGASLGPVAVDSAKKKTKKAKRCKKSQVRFKVGKRVTCRPLKKAMPKPRAGDPRKLFTKSVYTKDWSKFRSRRGKRPPSLPKLIRKTGRRAPALLTKATARGLRRIDAMASAAAVARAGPRARPAAANCAALSSGQRQSDSFTSRSGGSSATVGVNVGPEGSSMGIELSGNEYSVKADIDMGLCDPNEVEAPACPTAVGKLEGQIRYRFSVSIKVTKGDRNVWSQGAEVIRRTKLTGWNEVDAKLEQLDVEDVETSTFTLGGDTRGFPPTSIRTKLERSTQVNMRSGDYVPGRSVVNVRIDMEGLYGPDRDDAETDAERSAQASADSQFGPVIKKAIEGYRAREKDWQDPHKCAELKFSPIPNSTTLRGGDSGSFKATAIANSDGQPSELDARLTDLSNAIFEPTRAGGQSAQFTYRDVVGSAPAGSRVSVKVRATSKAGVAEDTWWQPLKPPFEINEIAGNFSGSYSQGFSNGRTAHVTWTASGTFVRQVQPGVPGATGNYMLTAGIASYHFSGATITQHADCNMSGSAVVDLFQDGGGAIGVTPLDFSKPFEQGPHGYGGDVGLGPDPKVTLTMESCGPGAETEEGKQYEWPVGFPPLDTGDDQQVSPDAIHYDGSHSRSDSGVTYDYTWVLTGRKNP